MIWYSLPILLVLLVAATILWDWRRSGRLFRGPLPRSFRTRQSQQEAWRQICPNGTIDKADAFLRTWCDAFRFNPDDRYCFAPTDRIMDVYRACYPRWQFWKFGDSMEIETLMTDLSQQFAVKDESWHPDITLGEIVGMMKSPFEDDMAPSESGSHLNKNADVGIEH